MGQYIMHNPLTRSKGIMIGILKNLLWELHKCKLDEADQYVIIRGLLNQMSMTIVGVYAPNDHQAEFGGTLYLHIHNEKNEGLFIWGVFNTVMDVRIERSKLMITSLPLEFHKHIEKFELIDVWRGKMSLHGTDLIIQHATEHIQGLSNFFPTLSMCVKFSSASIVKSIFSSCSSNDGLDVQRSKIKTIGE